MTATLNWQDWDIPSGGQEPEAGYCIVNGVRYRAKYAYQGINGFNVAMVVAKLPDKDSKWFWYCRTFLGGFDTAVNYLGRSEPNDTWEKAKDAQFEAEKWYFRNAIKMSQLWFHASYVSSQIQDHGHDHEHVSE